MNTETTNPAAATDVRMDAYLNRLATALRHMPPAEKQDILLEIRAHVLDSVAASSDRKGAVDRVLRLLGTPEELAQRYDTERLLTRASRSFSPWLLLRTSWRWAKAGMKGTVAFFLALIGYGTAFGITIALILKPIMPSRVGVWWGRGDLNIGMVDHPEQMHELLGQWFVPVMAVFAFALAAGTTQALRWLMRRRGTIQYGSPMSF
ncbi:MAG: hypothetical protein ABR874_06810 [Candidatus Sulfotelmatobacter sp.]|jgi:HAAS domain-containing protein